ncbi:MAG: hypothetical protein ACRDNS_34390, partial [Trebonia sp.]
MNTIACPRPTLNFQADDPSLTPHAGLALVGETARILDVVATIDRAVGGFKQRRRGLSAGEYLLALAESQLVGGDYFADLDTVRADHAGAVVRAVADPPAARTALELGQRFAGAQMAALAPVQAALTRRLVAALPRARRRALLRQRPTIDLDPTDVETYGPLKERMGWTHNGAWAGRPVLVTWAEAGTVLTGRLLAGNQDPRPTAPTLVRQAIAALPSGCRRPRVRCDAGLFDGAVAWAAVDAGADFAIAAARNA